MERRRDAFVTVAREESFTKGAAVKPGVSHSALSQANRSLEERLGMRLLTRTTRRVSPTEAGKRLLDTAGPRFEEIQAELAALSEMRDRPTGTVRTTAGEHSAISVLAPALERFLPDNPDVTVEIIVDYRLADIVAERFDAGVRLGEQVAKDMIAAPIGPDVRMAVVGSPAYFPPEPFACDTAGPPRSQDQPAASSFAFRAYRSACSSSPIAASRRDRFRCVWGSAGRNLIAVR